VNDIMCSEIKMTDAQHLGEGELSMSRIGCIEKIRIEEFAKEIKSRFDCQSMLLAKADSASREVSRVCVLGGACDRSFIDAAISSGADVLVTGDASYNNILDANLEGMHMICLGHYSSENIVLRWFDEKLSSLDITTYKFDCGYFEYL
ncbi:MAG: Nif3-like dinuclear metal center hexameric protein, partial [Clostridia bacterium]|nr:Nif3-like dinuclear metal center hexameric protein [Clostridia bacterium]